MNARLALSLSLGLSLLVAIPMLRSVVTQSRALTRPDTRTLAGEWMLANIPSGSRVLMESNTPQLPKDAFTFFRVGGDGTLLRVDAKKINHRLLRPAGDIGRLEDPRLIAEERIQVLVMSNRYDRYLAEGERYSRRVRIYDSITQDARLIYEIEGVRGADAYHRGGPRIRIYEIE